MSTRAIRFLNQKGIHFDVIEYEHEEKGAVFTAEAIGFPPERTIKTLVVDLSHKGCIIALMPGDRSLGPKDILLAVDGDVLGIAQNQD